ncbi:restriction endonuclease subunit S [Paenibacillus sp. FSL K6-2862]|uniref:restriction endonuclease subunit S n=1 Tax=Paenibacillus sp. FSL K6-2862 TaxID=2921484 RepID=UPI0030FB78F2
MIDTKLNFNYVPLSFVSTQDDFKRQLKNTVIMKYVLDTYNNPKKLSKHLIDTRYGFTDSAKSEGTHKFLRISDIKDGNVDWDAVPYCICENDTNYLLKEKDILIARTGGTTGKSFLMDRIIFPSVYASYLIRLRASSDLNPLYLYLFLNSYIYWNQIVELKQGSAQPNVNAEKLKSLVFPYCDLEMQEKLIALASTNNSDPRLTEIEENIRQLELKLKSIEQLSDLFHTQESLSQNLRESILQEAIQGKLVPQDPNDTPASVFLERIRVEKEQLIKEKKIKKEKPLPKITEDEIPYALPIGWEWVRLVSISSKLGAGSTPTGGKKVYTDNGTMFIRSQNVWNSGLKVADIAYISDEINNKMQGSIVKANDILLNITGASIGRSCVLDKDFDTANVNQHVSIIRLVEPEMNAFIHKCIISPYIQKLIMDVQVGVSREGLSMDKLGRFLIPIPPLNEQIRIIEKIDQLMALCDELDKNVDQSKRDSEMLMQSVLQVAFNQSENEDNVLEFPSANSCEIVGDWEIAARSDGEINTETKVKIKNRVTELLGKSQQ